MKCSSASVCFALTCFALDCLSSLPLVAEDWQLQPLRYEQPGLVVDLGVGLWAWPLPMDYDGDGDMDLLVSCPDKPSNGVYFFENPTQDPGKQMPIFKSGVRLGATGHNMQVSYVGGKPRLLMENKELTAFLAGDFSKKTAVYPQSRFHPGNTRARMWRYVDYDGDGDQDLIVGIGDWSDYGWDHAYDNHGRWRNGPLHGFVYLIVNDGSDESPRYSEHSRRLQAGHGDIDVYGWPSPCFADFDGDGDLDLICGEFLDQFTYFQNLGTRQEPIYAAGRRLSSQSGIPLAMDLQMITPTAIDWDGDGDFDLIVGDEDGRVAFIEHTGRSNSVGPVFKDPVYFQQEADTLKCGALATPYACDWDGDGDQDILCGNTAGYIELFENRGMSATGLPRWNAPKRLHSDGEVFRVMAGPNGSIQGPCEAKWGYTTLSVADLDGDQDPDILYNSIWGRLGALFNDDGELTRVELAHQPESPPAWFWWQTASPTSLTQWRTTPVVADFDRDGQQDLICLDQQGFLTLRAVGGPPRRVFIDQDDQAWQLNKKSCGGSGRVKLAVADWDGDGRTDVLVNSENATWYRNCETRDGRFVLKKIGNLARRNVAGHTSSPAVCDFDNDGKLDLLIGAENGRIYHIKHDDCIVYDEANLGARPANKAPQPRFPGLVSEDFVFTKAKFPQCHASTICETSRGMVVAWFGGTKEKAKDVGIWSSYFDGNSWTTPKEWANGVQHADLRHPCWNPVLYQGPGDAPTLLFFKVGPNPRQWWGEWMVSYDRGRTFRDRKRLPESFDGPVRCKPILLSDGRTLLCGSSTEYDGWRVHFEKTVLVDGLPQDTWHRIGPINTGKTFNAIQPTFLRHRDGTLQVLCRTQESVIVTSFSSDEGETWSDLEATNLPNPNAGIEVVTLTDGRHLLIYNHLGAAKTGWGRRGMLNLAISDDGKQWHKVAVLEEEQKSEFSYPAIIQASDGMVHMTYTWKRQRIKHVVVDPNQIETGAALSTKSWHD